jgi:hypothetical protein
MAYRSDRRQEHAARIHQLMAEQARKDAEWVSWPMGRFPYCYPRTVSFKRLRASGLRDRGRFWRLRIEVLIGARSLYAPRPGQPSERRRGPGH